MKKHPAKFSFVLLTVIFVVIFWPFFLNLFSGELDKALNWILLFLIVLFAWILHMFLNTHYTIDNRALKIKCGFISYKPIEIETIKEVSKTKSIMSSPAPSFDRIEIKYGKFDEVIISPKNKYDFVQDLIEINPNIKNNLT